MTYLGLRWHSGIVSIILQQSIVFLQIHNFLPFLEFYLIRKTNRNFSLTIF